MNEENRRSTDIRTHEELIDGWTLPNAVREIERLKSGGWEWVKRTETAEKALREILKRHDDGKCTCGGCCIARGALTGKRGDDVSALVLP